MKDPIRDELHRLNKEFKNLLGEPIPEDNNTITIEQLIYRFGLTLKEAKYWLKHEPNYVRRKVTDRKSNGKVTEPR